MKEKELIDLMLLQHAVGIGDITSKKLIQFCGSATAVFEEKPSILERIDGVGKFVLRMLKDAYRPEEAYEELEYIKTNGIKVAVYTESGYPERLKHCVDGPLILYVKGGEGLNSKRMISIVGTRQMSGYGKRVCEELIRGLAIMDPVIISGFAYGVDICAHRVAMEHKLKTIACLGHGLGSLYPAVHARYVPEMMNSGGFLTDFWSGDKAERNNFLRRNRIIAGMSEATIVIESAGKGGALVTADIANSYNREVFAVPGKVTDHYSAGCNELIKKQRAHLLQSAEDLIYMLGWNPDELSGKKSVQTQLFTDLTDDEEQIMTFLKKGGKQLLDDIALICKKPVHKVAVDLLNMEMKGIVRPLPGKYFEIC
ncbi:DNA-processing protein DprA [Robertkochia solimangrovi]|uniref:DNA-processing protein DprA n=1 Tax=Robertkochia solimangrovi TaxID=2213046 RepID=UPI00117D8201|nr:DNA-processing protein DprA [Robertkochia solimangrovi]TRZ45990.1 DNA-protecting protein DprA [Robertkochia solimangrovi]